MEPVIMACCVLMLATLLSILIIQITIIQKLKENNLQLQLFSTQTPLPNRTALYQDLKKVCRNMEPKIQPFYMWT